MLWFFTGIAHYNWFLRFKVLKVDSALVAWETKLECLLDGKPLHIVQDEIDVNQRLLIKQTFLG